jgi:hypothetical protein
MEEDPPHPVSESVAKAKMAETAIEIIRTFTKLLLKQRFRSD